MTYDRDRLERMRMRLLERRQNLVRSARRGSRELESLLSQDRRPELEEGAQSAAAEYVLTQLNDAQRREVGQIDAALSRIDAGTYGVCVDCGEDIPVERMRVLPFALRDADCEARREAEELGDRELPLA